MAMCAIVESIIAGEEDEEEAGGGSTAAVAPVQSVGDDRPREPLHAETAVIVAGKERTSWCGDVDCAESIIAGEEDEEEAGGLPRLHHRLRPSNRTAMTVRGSRCMLEPLSSLRRKNCWATTLSFGTPSF